MTSPAILQLFLDEARTRLELLGDDSHATEHRIEAARDLEQAAVLAGAKVIGRTAAQLAEMLRDPRTGGEVEFAALLGDLRQRLATLAASRETIDLSLESVDDDFTEIAGPPVAVVPHPLSDLPPPTEPVEPIGTDAPSNAALALTDRPRESPAPLPSPTDTGFAEHELLLLRSLLRDEAPESLEEITRSILDAGSDGPVDSTFDELMRTTHSLKGSAATVGLGELAEAAHQLEDHFDRVRSGRLRWSATVVDAFVDTLDSIRAYVDVMAEPETGAAVATHLKDRLVALSSLRHTPVPGTNIDPPSQIDFDDATVIEAAHGEDSTSTIVGQHIQDRAGEQAQPSRSRRPTELPVLRVDPGRVDRLMDSVGELVFDRTRIERRAQELRALAHEVGAARQKLRDLVASLAHLGEASALAQLEVELAETAAHLSRSTAALLDDTQSLRRTGLALEQGLTEVRMMSVGVLFERLAPHVRSIARTAHKKVRLVTKGDDTQFDKAVAELVTDPLVQLLRNAVAHGIETSAQRLAAGKKEEGLITLSARHSGDSILIEVEDDGAGIDPTDLRDRLVKTGHWSPTRARLATDEEVLRAIFDAGMTSRDHADQLAGRGVGLDAVRDTLARLGGEIHVTSTPGKGTLFALRLPLTAALTQALLFKLGGEVYAVRHAHVVETAYIDAHEIVPAAELSVRGQSVPLLDLHRVIGADISSNAKSIPVVIMSYAGKRLGLTCDKVVGSRQIVAKTLGRMLAPLPLFAAGTISGSGKVQLILDSATLVRLAHRRPVRAGDHVGKNKSASARERSRRALVADDSRATREAMTRMLERLGIVVDVADQGARALAMLDETAYDILVTDVEMPVLGGFELVARIATRPELAHLRIVVISSRTSTDYLRRAHELGVTEYLAKPVTSTVLAAALERLK